jgi:hypothetical protein
MNYVFCEQNGQTRTSPNCCQESGETIFTVPSGSPMDANPWTCELCICNPP